MTPEQIFGIVLALLFAFLLLRELFCWYFKINKRLSVLVDIRTELIEANKCRNEVVYPEALTSEQIDTTTKTKQVFWGTE